MGLIDIKSLSLEQLIDDFKLKNYPSYRAKQVYKWLYDGTMTFNNMLNVPKSMRDELSSIYYICRLEIEKKLESKIDGTKKYLFKLQDNEYIESVLMKYKHGYSACISTQVGCKMGCRFCATGMNGFSRNLCPSEMISQIQTIQDDNNIRISNIVLMGMGEPLDNYDNVLKFLRLVSSKNGLNMGMRHISLSTCGLVDKIYKLAEENLQITLSISLHASNNTIRNMSMPINKKWDIHNLLNACRFYIEKTNRRISFEYAMIDGVNDSDKHAYELANLLKDMLCHVNLIPINRVYGAGFKKSKANRLDNFNGILTSKGINVTIRRTLGADINASCGQLRGSI